MVIKKKKPTFLEPRSGEIITPSKLENKVPYQRISGAPYISLSINDQRSMKEQVSFDVYKRIGKIEHIETLYDDGFLHQAHIITEIKWNIPFHVYSTI